MNFISESLIAAIQVTIFMHEHFSNCSINGGLVNLTAYIDIDFLFIVFIVSFSCRCHVDLS